MSADEKKVLVAISGRVDSGVTAALLKTEGYRVAGLHLRITLPEEIRRLMKLRCLASNDERAAQEVCAKLGIPLHVVEAGEAFLAQVVDPTVVDAIQSHQSIPCLACHQKIRLLTLLREADARKFRWVATGHYAQISVGSTDQSQEMVQLRRASDSQSDQSHLLSGLGPSALSRLLTPLGGISKAMVKKLAKEFNLPVQTEESCSETGCDFRGENFNELIELRTADSLRPAGIVRTARGEILGEHDGLYRYAIGDQITQPSLMPNRPDENHVIAHDRSAQALILGFQEDLSEEAFIAEQATWIKPQGGIRGVRCSARVGRRSEIVFCQVTQFEAGMLQIEFEKPLQAVNSGESVCFYEGDEVLGGAVIQGPVSSEARGKKSK